MKAVQYSQNLHSTYFWFKINHYYLQLHISIPILKIVPRSRYTCQFTRVTTVLPTCTEWFTSKINGGNNHLNGEGQMSPWKQKIEKGMMYGVL